MKTFSASCTVKDLPMKLLEITALQGTAEINEANAKFDQQFEKTYQSSLDRNETIERLLDSEAFQDIPKEEFGGDCWENGHDVVNNNEL